ncbi:MAG TPA: hypothetical protein VFS43_40885 [Polyangiaceae bacterium]|nr:hypothetical protein [Polyangiaceae bacterium]
MTTDAPPPPADEAGGGGAPDEAEPKNVGGRPTKLTQELIDRIARSFEHGASINLACMAEGIATETHRLWYREGERDAAAGLDTLKARFFGVSARGRGGFALKALKWLWDNRDAPASKKSADNVRFLLEKQFPGDIGSRQSVELTGPGGGPLQVQSLEEAIAQARRGPAGGGEGGTP